MAGRRSTRPRVGGHTPARKPSARRRDPRSGPAARARPSRASGAFQVLAHHMAFSSHDVDRVRRFYTETLGLEDFSLEPELQYVSVRTSRGASIGFMPPLPGPPEQWRPPREPAMHLVVGDVDRAHRVLTARGVMFEQAPADMAHGYRTAVLRDPEGRVICLAQSIPQRSARRSSR